MTVESPVLAAHDAAGSARLAALRGLRVAIVLPSFEMGGAERQALLFARALHGHGVDVGLWGVHGAEQGAVSRAAAAAGIPARRCSVRWFGTRRQKVVALWRFARALRAVRVDVLLPFTDIPNVACTLVAPLVRPRGLVWNQRDTGGTPFSARLLGWSAKRATVCVANSAAVRAHLVSRLGVAPARVRLVLNGVALDPPQRNAAAWRRALDLGDGLVACMVANLHTLKDHATLLRAWRLVLPRLAATGRAASLVLAGRPENAAALIRALIEELGIAGSLRLAGNVDDVSGLLGSADLGVLCSHTEGSPNAVLEYMAAGLAVTGTELAGIRECLGDDAPLAAPGDADTLAGHIVRLACDPAARAAAGARNRARAETRYAPAVMVDALAGALLDSLGASPARPRR